MILDSDLDNTGTSSGGGSVVTLRVWRGTEVCMYCEMWTHQIDDQSLLFLSALWIVCPSDPSCPKDGVCSCVFGGGLVVGVVVVREMLCQQGSSAQIGVGTAVLCFTICIRIPREGLKRVWEQGVFFEVQRLVCLRTKLCSRFVR